jgi:predicted ArsR family transcriptional regulator
VAATSAGPSRLTTTDPERIRALSHPLRLVLLDLLNDEGDATATRCAELTGESVPSCSFHLRMLAKYGYVEPAERRGREKPWRLTARRREVRPDAGDPASVRAVETLATLTVEQEAARIRDWLATATAEPAEWLDAITVARSSFWATAEELAEFGRDLRALSDRFAGRWTDPSLRPPGSRPARLFAVANPDPADDSHRYRQPGRGRP